MKSQEQLKKESVIIRNEKEANFKNKLIPIATKIFNDNKDIFLKNIENQIKQEMENGYGRMFFQMYAQVEQLCKDFNINEYKEVSFINNFIEDKLISILKKHGYLYSYVYRYSDRSHTNYYIFWSRLQFIKCKIKNFLKIS